MGWRSNGRAALLVVKGIKDRELDVASLAGRDGAEEEDEEEEELESDEELSDSVFSQRFEVPRL